MAVQAEEAAPVVPVPFAASGAASSAGSAASPSPARRVAALYLVLAPLLALLATAFRGPSDMLPFEPGAHWTFDNLVDVYVGHHAANERRCPTRRSSSPARWR